MSDDNVTPNNSDDTASASDGAELKRYIEDFDDVIN
jgi:hypothetical protein